MAEKCSATGGKALLTDRHYKFFTVTRLLQDAYVPGYISGGSIQGSNGDADIENRSVNMVGEEERRTNEDSSMETHTHTSVWKAASGTWL